MEKVYAESAKNYDIEHSVTLFEKMLHEAISDHNQGHNQSAGPVQYSVSNTPMTLDHSA